jgi:hypothetical protein
MPVGVYTIPRTKNVEFPNIKKCHLTSFRVLVVSFHHCILLKLVLGLLSLSNARFSSVRMYRMMVAFSGTEREGPLVDLRKIIIFKQNQFKSQRKYFTVHN